MGSLMNFLNQVKFPFKADTIKDFGYGFSSIFV